MRFLADMGISLRCVEWLRSIGHEAVHLAEQGLHKLSDSDVLHKAKSEKRILLTMDLDFARLVSSAGMEGLPVVVLFRLSDQRPQNVRTRLGAITGALEALPPGRGAVVSVSDNKVRVRQLPIF